MLTISRNGTTKFLFNNAELVLPDICVAGTIACHGINGVLTGDGAATACSKRNHITLGPSENSTGLALAILDSRNIFGTVISGIILLLLKLMTN